MKHYYSIGEAAKAVGLTTETLRHYDRIGLAKPTKTDEWTHYRYYSEHDIVRLHTVKILQIMDLTLQEIKEVLEYDDLEKIVEFLSQAEERADEKIAALQYGKSKIQLAKNDYEKKIREKHTVEGSFIQEFPRRVIMLSDTLETPTLDNFWNYLSHFYERIDPSLREQFDFEDLAGIYTEEGFSRLFALCLRYVDVDGLKTLPPGNYLCADCTEEDRESVLEELMEEARRHHRVTPEFSVQIVLVAGILHWNYQVQVFLG